jgi:ATP-dependent RNA helicase DDX18/HAS1
LCARHFPVIFSFPPPAAPRCCSQGQLESLVEKNYYLNRSAKDAYRSYILAYASHSLKHIFAVHLLDLAAVAKGFGFSTPPRVNLNVSATGHGHSQAGKGGRGEDGDEEEEGAGSGSRQRGGGGHASHAKFAASRIADPRKRAAAVMKLKAGTGHSFSASNPYGKRAAGDARQFTR